MSNRINVAPDCWFQLPAPKTVPCVRCGYHRRGNESRPTSPLCRDCLHVCADLGELEQWTEAA